MPAWTRGRLKTLIFVALLVAVLVVVASFLYFRASPRAPQGADVVQGPRPARPATWVQGPRCAGPALEPRGVRV